MSSLNVTEAILVLKENGYKYTDKREALLQIFSKHDRYLSAKEVLEFVHANFFRLSYDTIYRNLAIFVDLGIIEQTELSGEKHFRFSCCSSHHHHFICNQCGMTKNIEFCPMDGVAENLIGYQISSHKFEVYGTCPNCEK